VEEGYISEREGELALAMRAPVAQQSVTSAGYVADWVAELVRGYVGEITEDVIVDTTIDMRLQAEAEDALIAVMTEGGPEKNAGQAALVSIDGIGAVRALVGGVSYRQSQFNRAVTAQRQPGSSFKPFVYLAALEYGLSPSSVRIDGPTRIRGWAPSNYAGDHLGPISISEGLARSVNTIAARLTHEVGADNVARTAKRLGIRTDLHENPSLALGTAEVSLFELTSAYVPFANGGFGMVPHVVTRIETRSGRLLYERSGDGPGRVIEPGHLGMMNFMMRRVVEEGTGRRARLDGWGVAGKTGTSQDFKDAWFMGYTANLVTGVWVGNDDGTPMKKVTGGNLPAMIFHDYMTAAHQGVPPIALPGQYDPRFDAPGGENVQVDADLPWLAPAGGTQVAQAPGTTGPRGYNRPQGTDAGGGFFRIDAGFLNRIFGN